MKTTFEKRITSAKFSLLDNRAVALKKELAQIDNIKKLAAKIEAAWPEAKQGQESRSYLNWTLKVATENQVSGKLEEVTQKAEKMFKATAVRKTAVNTVKLPGLEFIVERNGKSIDLTLYFEFEA